MENELVRDKLQKGIYKIINPLVKGMIKIGFTPNLVTVTGLLLNIGVAIIFIMGAEEGHRGDLSYVGCDPVCHPIASKFRSRSRQSHFDFLSPRAKIDAT